MTPHNSKTEVGIRELHDKLSHYVHHVEAGGEVIVTSRGRRIARLVPVDAEDPLEELRHRGLVREPTRRRRRASGRSRPSPSAPVADLVAKQRR